MTNKHIDISVVIPSYNSESFLGNCLNALTNQKTELQYEIIVVDSSNHDRVKNICQDVENVIFVKRNEKTNPGIGRNIGAEVANGKLLVFIDSDLTFDNDAFDNIWNASKNGYKVFGGALELHKDYRLKLSSVVEHYFFNHESQKNRNESLRSNLSSALIIFDRNFFKESGGFKNIPRMQDTEFTERLRSNGTNLHFVPEVVGYQVQDSHLAQVFKKIYINGRNIYPIRYKNKSTIFKIALFFLLPLISLAKATRICIRNIYYLDKHEKLIAILTSPFIYAGCLIWMIGIYEALLLNKDIVKSR